MLFMPPFERVSWSNVFHTNRKIVVKFIAFASWLQLAETGEVVEYVGGVSLVVRRMLISWLQSREQTYLFFTGVGIGSGSSVLLNVTQSIKRVVSCMNEIVGGVDPVYLPFGLFEIL